MAQRTISTRITLDGEKEFKQQMALVNSELKTLRSELSYTEERFKGQANTMEALTEKDRILRKEIEQQTEKVKALEQAVADATEAYGEADRRTDSYKQQLNNARTALLRMNGELDENSQYLREAEDSADRAARSIDEFGREVKDADNQIGGAKGFKDLAGNIQDLYGMVKGGVVVAGIAALTEAVTGIVDETAEYRMTMGTLEVSSERVGYTMNQTTEVFRKLHSVIGDNQAAAEATAQLQALQLSQEDLVAITDATIGSWVALGRAAPIESIAESVQQTISAGQATGAFSDILVNAGISEDAFNTKLEHTKTAAERADLIMRTLSRQGLTQLGESWMKNNEEIVKLNEAQAEWEAATGRLGTILAPAATALVNFGADALSFVINKVSTAVEWFQKLNEWIPSEETFNKYTANRSGSNAINGSHANGLSYVPFNGYRAELHEGERVLTKSENAALDVLTQRLTAPAAGVTAADMQRITAAAVNAVNAGRSAEPTKAEFRLVLDNGAEIARWLVPDIRSVMKSDPEVMSD